MRIAAHDNDNGALKRDLNDYEDKNKIVESSDDDEYKDLFPRKKPKHDKKGSTKLTKKPTKTSAIPQKKSKGKTKK